MPFSTDERLALAHNFLMQALQNLAHSFLCRDPSAAKHGHEIRFRADNQVYEYLGSRKHCYQLGARSFERIVTTEAVLPIVSKYLDKVSGNAKNFRGHITLVVNQSKSGLEANVD